MTPDPSEFVTVDEHRMVRKVKAPMPEDGSGYRTEENRQWLYRVGDTVAHVRKVSNLGWSTALYKESKAGNLQLEDILCNEESAQIAHRRAIVEIGA